MDSRQTPTQADERIDFLREQIKQRPMNKKRLLRRTVITAILAVVFGLVACLVFLLFVPVINSRLNPEPVPETVTFPEEGDEMQPEEMVALDAEIETEVTAAAVAESMQEAVFEELMQGYAFRPQDYAHLYDALKETADTAAKSLVRVTLSPTTDCTGLLIADNDVQTLLLCSDAAASSDTTTVTFPDGAVYEAELIASDPRAHLCVLGVDNRSLSLSSREAFALADLGSSVYLTGAGSGVIAIGAPTGTKDSVCYGFLTSVSEPLEVADAFYQLLTTDIYAPQTADGVLIDLNGRIIGWIDMRYNPATVPNRLSAIGITELKPLIGNLSNGKPHAFLGVTGGIVPSAVKTAQEIPDGAYITSVIMNSPAMNVGIQSGDIITKMEDVPITDYPALCTALLSRTPEETVTLQVLRERGGSYSEMEIEVTLRSE